MHKAASLALLGLFTLVAPAGAAEQPEAGEPRVRLLSPGRPPLRPLRYHSKVGDRGAFSLSMNMAMKMAMDGQAMPSSPTPEMRFSLDYKVTALTPEGDIRYDFEFGAFEALPTPNVPAAMLDAVSKALASIKGVRGHAVVTSRGVTRETDITVPPDAPPAVKALEGNLKESMKQMSAPFPVEPVGEGARWETAYKLTQNGLTIEQTATTELAALKDDLGRLAIRFVQKAAPQRMPTPGAGPDTKADLLSLSSTGDGETAFDLARLTPTSARVSLKMQMKARIQVGAQKAQDMDMNMDMTMSVAGK